MQAYFIGNISYALSNSVLEYILLIHQTYSSDSLLSTSKPLSDFVTNLVDSFDRCFISIPLSLPVTVKSDFHLADRNSFFYRNLKILFSTFSTCPWELNLISFQYDISIVQKIEGRYNIQRNVLPIRFAIKIGWVELKNKSKL